MPGHQDLSVIVASGQNRVEVSHRKAFHDFTCGHCGHAVNGVVIAFCVEPDRKWLLCPRPECGQPSSETEGVLAPAALSGLPVEGLPEEVRRAYVEARRAHGVGAFTACELLCRKILMYVAVDRTGATEGQKFAQYISALETAGYVTPPMLPWVELIRAHGNEATHQLPSVDARRAMGTLTFTAELLRLSYEMEYLATRFTAPEPTPSAPGETSMPTAADESDA